MRAADLLHPLLDLRAGLTQGEGVGRYARELARALAGRGDVALAYFGATLARPARSPAECGLSGARGVRWRVPSKPLCALLARSALGVEHLLRGPVDLVHHTQYRRLPTRRPEVSTVHDLVFLDSDRFVGSATARRMSEFARGAVRTSRVIVTPSRAVAEEVRERLGVAPDRVVPAPLGVDHVLRVAPEPDAARRIADEVSAEGPFLFSAARIERRKNLEGVLAALEVLGAGGPRWVLAGPDGEGAEGFRAALERSPLRGRVRLLGRIPEGALRARLDACAAFVLVPHDEGFGLAPLEAAALGRPVVTSDVPVVREVCGGAAELAAPADPGGVAAALERALALDAGERERRRGVALAYSWARCADAHVAAYRRALA